MVHYTSALMRQAAGAHSSGGKHSLSFGQGLYRVWSSTNTSLDPRGTFDFTGGATAGIDPQSLAVPGTGSDFADFLLGRPALIGEGSNDKPIATITNKTYTFLQDDIQLAANWTLAIGLRYEFESPGFERTGRIANLVVARDFAAANVVTPATPGMPRGLLWPELYDFAPRIGLAWSVDRSGSYTIRTGYAIHYDASAYTQYLAWMSEQPPFASLETAKTIGGDQPLILLQGVSPFVSNTLAIQPHYRNVALQTWDLGLAARLSRDLLLSVTYTGAKGTHLPTRLLPNYTPGPASLEPGLPTGFVYQSSDGTSISDFLDTRLSVPLRSGLTLVGTYRISKILDDSSSLKNVGAGVAQDYRNLRAERALSDLDRKNMWVMNLSWFSTMDRSILSKSNISGAVARNWRISCSATIQDGAPMTPLVLGKSPPVGFETIGSGRASATGLPLTSSNSFFNLSAFAVPPAGEFGTAGRNTIPGPGWSSYNVAINRSFRLTPRAALVFSVSANNALNHRNITGINTIVDSALYGAITTVANMRTITPQLRVTF